MSLFTPPLVPAFDANGATLSGAKWYFYLTGTTTLADVYTTSARTVAHANPVVADSGGRFAPIFLDPDITYRAVLKTSADVAVPNGDIDPLDTVADTSTGVNVMNHGAAADGSTNDYAAFAAAIAALPNSGGTLILPAGEYYIGQTLHIRKPVRILGEGAGQNPGTVDGVTYSGPDIYHGTRLIFPQGTKWMHFHTHTDEDDVATVTAMTDAEKYVEFSAVGSVMRDLCLLGADLTSGATPPAYVANSEAIRINVPIELTNVWVINPSGDGIIVSASSASTSYPSDYGNANQCDFRKVKVYKAGRSGWLFEGADANICSLIGCDASFCGGWGYEDASFLGNTFINCHAQKNNQSTLATYGGVTLSQDYGSFCVHEDSAATTIYSPYIENPTTGEKMKLADLSVVEGGIGSAERYIDANTDGVVRGSTGVIAGILGAFNNINAVNVRGGLGSGPSKAELVALWFGSDDDTAAMDAYRLKYLTNRWALQYAGTQNIFDFITGDDATRAALTNGYCLGLPNGAALGSAASAPRILPSATAAPVAGTHVRGDIVFNSAPSAGGVPGWMCVTAGTPGTWKDMAALAA